MTPLEGPQQVPTTGAKLLDRTRGGCRKLRELSSKSQQSQGAKASDKQATSSQRVSVRASPVSGDNSCVGLELASNNFISGQRLESERERRLARLMSVYQIWKSGAERASAMINNVAYDPGQQQANNVASCPSSLIAPASPLVQRIATTTLSDPSQPARLSCEQHENHSHSHHQHHRNQHNHHSHRHRRTCNHHHNHQRSQLAMNLARQAQVEANYTRQGHSAHIYNGHSSSSNNNNNNNNNGDDNDSGAPIGSSPVVGADEAPNHRSILVQMPDSFASDETGDLGDRADNQRRADLNNDELELESLKETNKLWQTLVMPLVLGCIIFLLIIWTRQISLVLVNDTVMMVVILGSVFIIVSAMAFWLAQDDHKFELREQEPGPGAGPRGTITARDCRRTPSHRETYCRHHQHLHQSRGSNIGGHQQAAAKGCDLAIIDCQPPDYYSAMENSLPVYVRTNYHQDHEELNWHQIQISSSSLEPPSYFDLMQAKSFA